MTSIASVGAVLACLNDQRPVQYTPALFDGTLYAVTQQRRERVDKIHVITTLSGRDKITSMLLDLQHGQFYAFCRDYHIDPASINDETMLRLLCAPNERMLDDIRTVDDNSYAADQICEIVRELTPDPDTRLHASAAGGRKTMSIYLTAAMQIFGRGQDRLSHVLVDEYFEMHTGFFYIPPTPREVEITDRQGQARRLSTAQATIQLADIPFIRLRRVMSDWMRHSGSSYSAMVQRAQEDLGLVEAEHTLRINVGNKDKTVAVASRRVKLRERELFIYALMAYLRQQGRGDEGYVTLDEIEVDDLEAVFRRITSARGHEHGLDNVDLVARFGFLDKLAGYMASTHKDARTVVQKTFEQVFSKIKRQCEDAQLPERYQLTTRGERGALRYGLEVAPEHIIWEDAKP